MGSSVRTLTSSSALPVAAATTGVASVVSSFSSSSFSSSSSSNPGFHFKSYVPLSASLRSTCNFNSFQPVKGSSRPKAALYMDSAVIDQKPTVEHVGILPELMTEFMVDMKCEGCVSAVKDKLLKLNGVKHVDMDVHNQVVRVLGSLPVKTMEDALEQTGRKARLIGQGNSNDFLISAAVAEFKGPVTFGVVRLAQVSMELARIEASFSGLSPGKHGWSINEFGDLTRGAESTGEVYNPAEISFEKPIGDLGTLEALENGEAQFSGAKQMLRVVDLIGRSIVVYETEDKSDPGVSAAVIARSAGVGENYKKLCSCDGVTIWESS